MPIRSRRGEEMVEAAIVLPLVILTILSMIMISVFLFRFEIRQSEAHIEVMREAASSESVFGIKRRNVSMSAGIRGTASRTVHKGNAVRAYALNQAEAVMVGELAG